MSEAVESSIPKNFQPDFNNEKDVEKRFYPEDKETDNDTLGWYQEAFKSRFSQETQEYQQKIEQLFSELEALFELYDQEIGNQEIEAEPKTESVEATLGELIIDHNLMARFQRILDEVETLKTKYDFFANGGIENNFLRGDGHLKDYLFLARIERKPLLERLKILVSREKRATVACNFDLSKLEQADDKEVAFNWAVRHRDSSFFEWGELVDLGLITGRFNSQMDKLLGSIREEDQKLKERINLFHSNLPVDWEEFKAQRQLIVDSIDQFQVIYKEQIELLCSSPDLRTFNTIKKIAGGSIENLSDMPIDQILDYSKYYEFRLSESSKKAVDIEGRKSLILSQFGLKCDELRTKVDKKLFFETLIKHKIFQIRDELSRDGWCLTWSDDDIKKYGQLSQKALNGGLFDKYIDFKIDPDSIVEARDQYLENCQALSQFLFVHNSHHFYLQSAIENGFMGNTVASLRKFGSRTSRAVRGENDNPGNLAIFFQTLNPEVIKPGEGWFGYCLSLDATKLPDELRQKKSTPHTELNGIFFDISRLSQNMYGDRHPCLSFAPGSIEGACRGHQDENTLAESALTVSSDLAANPQSEPDLATHIDLTQNHNHSFPAIIYASETDRAKFLDTALRAGWGYDESGDFNQELFDGLIEKHFIFYPKDWNRLDKHSDDAIRENYHKIVTQAVKKIKKYFGGFKRGIYLSHGNDSASSRVSFINPEIPSGMDKFDWITLEENE